MQNWNDIENTGIEKGVATTLGAVGTIGIITSGLFLGSVFDCAPLLPKSTKMMFLLASTACLIAALCVAIHLVATKNERRKITNENPKIVAEEQHSGTINNI